MMAFFMPGVREKQLELCYRIISNHFLQNLDGIMADDADIVEACLYREMDEVADAGAMHLDADKILLRVLFCLGDQ